MTYGPHNPGQPGQYPPGQPPQGLPGQPPQYPGAYPPAPAATSPLLAPSGPATQRRTIVGAVAAVAALLLIVFSFLTWASASDSINEAGVSADMSVTVSGMGSVDTDLQMHNAPAGFEDMMNQSDSANEDTKMPGIWTVIFGILVGAGAALMLLRRFPGVGALLTVVGGLAATIASIVFIADPIGAVAKGTTGQDRELFSAGYGLWLVLIGSILALLAGAAMLALTLAPAKFDDAAPAPGGFGGPGQFPGQPPFPGQPQAQFGGQPQQQPFPGQPGAQFPGQQPFPGQHGPGQPGLAQQPPFGGQQYPGQQYPGQPPR